MAEYQLGFNDSYVLRLHPDGAQSSIPNDPENGDWIEYQAWLDAGGVPDPAPLVLGAPLYTWGPTMFEALGGSYYVGA